LAEINLGGHVADKTKIYKSDLPIQDKAAFLIICTAQELLNKLGAITKTFDLSLTQLQILHVLDLLPQEKVTVSTIRALLVEDSPNVSRSINKLAAQKRVVKERSSEDQRVVYISITDEGRRTHHDCDAQIVGHTLDLPDKASRQLVELLIKI
jgi:MarR family transcriptional regulator, organic hydroperoxide resistance regulator